MKYRAAVFMAVMALIFVGLHFWSGWEAFVQDAASHNEKAIMSEYLIVWFRDTVENLQSEFWQLAVQFALLAGFFKFMGIHAYEEDQEDVKERVMRIEAKLDEMAGSTSRR